MMMMRAMFMFEVIPDSPSRGLLRGCSKLVVQGYFDSIPKNRTIEKIGGRTILIVNDKLKNYRLMEILYFCKFKKLFSRASYNTQV